MSGILPMLDWTILIIVCVFIVLDYISGVIKGAKEHNIQSGMMFIGLLKKTAYFLVIALAITIEWAMNYLDLPFPLDLFVPVCVFIILIEIASILENIVVINPDLKSNKFLELFGVKTEDKEFEDKEGEKDAKRN